MLRFLSGDRWRVFFRDRTKRTRTLAVAPKRLAIDGLTKVSLLSGGLDSLIGAVDLLSGGERSLFVSHYWDSETAKAQAYILDRLENRFGKEAFKSLREIGRAHSELQSLMRISYAVFCLKKKKNKA